MGNTKDLSQCTIDMIDIIGPRPICIQHIIHNGIVFIQLRCITADGARPDVISADIHNHVTIFILQQTIDTSDNRRRIHELFFMVTDNSHFFHLHFYISGSEQWLGHIHVKEMYRLILKLHQPLCEINGNLAFSASGFADKYKINVVSNELF